MNNRNYIALLEIIDKESLIDRALKSLSSCLVEQKDLKGNISHQLSSFHMSIVEGFPDYYEREVKFILIKNYNRTVGYYRYIEDNNNTPIDDFLVFE